MPDQPIPDGGLQTVPQIAVIIGIPEGTVKSRLHKLINKIKHQLKKYEDK